MPLVNKIILLNAMEFFNAELVGLVILNNKVRLNAGILQLKLVFLFIKEALQRQTNTGITTGI